MSTAQEYKNGRTGAEVHLGRSGTGFYVEATHPAYALPLRKTYEWFQEDLATRDYEVLCALCGAMRTKRKSA